MLVDTAKPVIIEVKNAVLRYPMGRLAGTSIKTVFLKGKAEAQVPQRTYVEALSNVSFNVVRGERLGIIGRNGAGKSTILRAIAGIFPLATGSVHVSGRVRGLYDLTTGFEPEETGRRNILYRGYLLGYSQNQISELLQEIIDFSELGPFIDVPLKAYSSGMTIRLAFAISTVLGGDTLLIDEILAAGDAGFAMKAKARMLDLIHMANCLVFVSHDMNAIREICSRVIWLDQGCIREDGLPDVVIANYHAASLPAVVAGPPPPPARSFKSRLASRRRKVNVAHFA